MGIRSTIVTIVLAGGLVAACSASGASPLTSQVPVGQTVSPGASAAAIGTASSASLGTYLTGANGMALYTHAGDGPDSSTCTGDCATAWPPVTLPVGGQPTPGAGVTGKLGTMTRTDGTTQLTHDGLPLYYWQGDAKPGDTTGDGVNGFSVAKVGGAAPAPNTAAPAPSASAKSRY